MKKQPKLILVGAGPGDPELITLKGLKAIEKADAILYDALVSEELLKYAPATCVKVYVGKRYAQPSLPQQKINELIVEHALAYGTVVRLKGGDPFVFGRATEEIDAAEAAGIEVEIVPGLSSVTAVPAAAKIAITQRGISRGFRVITATTSAEELSDNIHCAAKCNETVVILMGINKLPLIAEIFAATGKGQVPVAVVQNGTLPEEKIIYGKVDDIAAKVQQAQLGSPGLIIIGETVSWSTAYLETIQKEIQPLVELVQI
jgi:uroporphyrin-III C-methyltransferase